MNSTQVLDHPQHQTVMSEPIRGGYRVRPARRHAFKRTSVQSILAILLFSLVAGGGIFWTLGDPNVVISETSIVKALLASAIYIVAASVFIAAGKSKLPTHVDVDQASRVLRLVSGRRSEREQVLRFEEVVRLRLEESSRLSDPYAFIAGLEFGCIVVDLAGGVSVPLMSGDISELETVLRDLRRDIDIT